MNLIKEKIRKIRMQMLEDKIMSKSRTLNYYENEKFSTVIYESYVDPKIGKLYSELEKLEDKLEKMEKEDREK